MQMLLELDIAILCDKTAYFRGTVPVTFLSELSSEDAFEAELEENTQRVDLTWQERANATAALHNFRAKQNEGIQSQTIKATTTEILGETATRNDELGIRDDLLIAQHLTDENVAKAGSKKEALKIIEKKAKVAHRAKLAEQFDTTRSKHKLIKGDSLELLSSLESGTFDCLLTDPPYGVDADKFGSNFASEHTYHDSWEYFCDISRTLATEAFRLLRDNSHAYVFCSFEGFIVLAENFANAGFRVWPQPLIWSKSNGNAPWVSEGHKRTYECIMFASKGHREMNVVKPDVIIMSPDINRDHAAQKPWQLLADLLGRSTNPGNLVLDPFAGSGSIFPACDASSCRAVGIERSEESFNIALTRMESIL
jgi:site-specific DNA-methyltransferase (adenine-specific)